MNFNLKLLIQMLIECYFLGKFIFFGCNFVPENKTKMIRTGYLIAFVIAIFSIINIAKPTNHHRICHYMQISHLLLFRLLGINEDIRNHINDDIFSLFLCIQAVQWFRNKSITQILMQALQELLWDSFLQLTSKTDNHEIDCFSWSQQLLELSAFARKQTFNM